MNVFLGGVRCVHTCRLGIRCQRLHSCDHVYGCVIQQKVSTWSVALL